MLDRPTSNAVRQRRHRLRQKSGEVMVTVGLSQDETAKLVRLRCLDDGKQEDRAAIVQAVHLLLASISDA
jgi:hypothetical protein